MRTFIIITLYLFVQQTLNAQEASNKKVHWYASPEYSMMFMEEGIGNVVGFQAGIGLLKNRLQLGFYYYGRSGPINPQEYVLELPAETTYNGKTQLNLRADAGAFGLVVTPTIPIGEKATLEFPLTVGQMGAGFYIQEADRNTPDGRRVSEWENELMDGRDASFALLLDGGVRARFPITNLEGIEAGFGVHYAHHIGWDTFVGGTDFYNVPRAVAFLRFGN